MSQFERRFEDYLKSIREACPGYTEDTIGFFAMQRDFEEDAVRSANVRLAVMALEQDNERYAAIQMQRQGLEPSEEDGRWDNVDWDRVKRQLAESNAKRVETIPNMIEELEDIHNDLIRTRPSRLGGDEEKRRMLSELLSVTRRLERGQDAYNAKRKERRKKQ